MSRTFVQMLSELRELVLRMGAHSEAILSKSLRALREKNVVLAAEVKHDDLEIDRLDLAIDKGVLNALALQAPVAADLRTILAIKMTAHELERIGDLARNIAKSAIRIAERPEVVISNRLDDLSVKSQEMLRHALDAFSRNDPRQAEVVLDSDDKIDRLQDEVIHFELAQIPAQPENAFQAIDIMQVAKNLERIGDHATNIAENVILMAEARNVKHATKL